MTKAGLKGDPSDYYKLHKENKMTGQKIRESMGEKTIAGYAYGFPWSLKMDKNGETEFTDLSGVHKGKTWIEGDALCSQYETRFDRLKDCSNIYKNPEGDEITLSKYFALTDYGLFPFSVKE